VTRLLRLGAANLLEVTVSKVSADDSVNFAERSADYWIFGGIYRPVYLAVRPRESIERVAIDARADGSFRAEAFLDGIASADSVEGRIETLEGARVSAPFRASISPGQSRAALASSVASPRTAH
jgi:beta-galactosidase/beta-glucuronidase